MGNSPCMGCSGRWLGCHGNCQKYFAWQEENKKEKAFLQKGKLAGAILTEGLLDRRDSYEKGVKTKG